MLLKLLQRTRLFDIRRFADLFLFVATFVIAAVLTGKNKSLSPTVLALLAVLVGLCQFIVLLPVVFRERKWRNVSAYDAVQISQAVGISSALVLVLSYYFSGDWSWFSTLSFDALLSISVLCAIRLARRLHFEERNKKANLRLGKRTLIYGTGSAARALAFRFLSDPNLQIYLVGFIDASLLQVGSRVFGLKVLGTPRELEAILEAYSIQEFIVADPSVAGSDLKHLLDSANVKKVKVRILSDDSFGSQSGNSGEKLRDIELLDLLKRPAIQVDLHSAAQLISGRTVLVTGGGGSIGSELVRQIERLKPYKLLVLDQSEFNLYTVESSLREMDSKVPFVALLSDLKEARLLNDIFKKHKPDIIFHAAAYKHVHLVETNANASILNNLVSIQNLLTCAVEHQVQHFILISSDKAVNPKGIMGATKRACELLVTDVAEESGYQYCSVRFGNVLGSSGSFIPLLKKQILAGGAVTITHEDMERFFMLIPEAVSLVLKAASISNPGDISILKMGQSIKIVDIAKSLIALLGKAEAQVPLVFTGMRPGEKLREELYLSGNEIKTEHPDIVVLPRGAQLNSGPDQIRQNTTRAIREIVFRAQNADERAAALLYSLVKFEEQDLLAEARNKTKGEAGNKTSDELRIEAHGHDIKERSA